MKMTAEEKQARLNARRQEREAKKLQEQIIAERNQPEVKLIRITIEWRKSRTWGMTPHAEACVVLKNGNSSGYNGFTCSGCGYDKESTIIAQIFNRFLKYKLWKIYDDIQANPNIRASLPYGIAHSYDRAIYYSEGIGTCCYYKIAAYIGGQLTHVASGKTFDIYEYTDGYNNGTK